MALRMIDIGNLHHSACSIADEWVPNIENGVYLGSAIVRGREPYATRFRLYLKALRPDKKQRAKIKEMVGDEDFNFKIDAEALQRVRDRGRVEHRGDNPFLSGLPGSCRNYVESLI